MLLRRSVIITAIIMVAFSGGYVAFSSASREPAAATFNQKCSQCHGLPDLAGYPREGIAPLVLSMRFSNDPESMISDGEAQEIIDYLESFAAGEDQTLDETASLWSTTSFHPRAPAGTFEIEIILDRLTFPSSINFTPDDNLLILERGYLDQKTGGRYPPKLKSFDIATGELKLVGVIADSDVTPAHHETINGGALGLAVDPEFDDNRRVYICYHYLRDQDDHKSGANRLSRFVIGETLLTEELVLVDQVSAGNAHNGCRVVVGPDEHIYFATGAGARNLDAQDPYSTAGKILRIRRDGSIPPDNPFPNSPVWSYGHRNPQGLAFDLSTGFLWSTEHGPATDDELNLIEKGKNYGWPYCAGEVEMGEPWGHSKGPWSIRATIGALRRGDLTEVRRLWIRRRTCSGEGLDHAEYRPAVKAYYSYPTRSAAISDLVFYTGDAFPGWRDSLFFVTLKTGRLIRATVEDGRVKAHELLIDGSDEANFGRLRDVTMGPDGFLYVVTNVTNPEGVPTARPKNPRGGMLLRVRPQFEDQP